MRSPTDRQRRRDSRHLNWEGALNVQRMHAHLNKETDAEADTPEEVLVEDEIAAAGKPKPVRM